MKYNKKAKTELMEKFGESELGKMQFCKENGMSIQTFNNWLKEKTVSSTSFVKVNCKENERLSKARYIKKNGIAFFELTKRQDLEGIVAKKKTSRYKIMLYMEYISDLIHGIQSICL